MPCTLIVSKNMCYKHTLISCDNSETIVYEWINERFGDYDERRKMYNIAESDVREVYRFTLNETSHCLTQQCLIKLKLQVQ